MKTTFMYDLFKWSTIDEFTPNDERVPPLLLSQFTPFIFTTFAQRKSTIIQKHEKFKSNPTEKNRRFLNTGGKNVILKSDLKKDNSKTRQIMMPKIYRIIE